MAHWPLGPKQHHLISGLLLLLSGSAVGETITLAVHLEDADVMGQPVEQCAGEALGAEGVDFHSELSRDFHRELSRF